jgi:hypothetical protein
MGTTAVSVKQWEEILHDPMAKAKQQACNKPILASLKSYI